MPRPDPSGQTIPVFLRCRKAAPYPIRYPVLSFIRVHSSFVNSEQSTKLNDLPTRLSSRRYSSHAETPTDTISPVRESNSISFTRSSTTRVWEEVFKGCGHVYRGHG